ncbi:hypothetical protein [Tateyamaria omphalii]|nr:hypothetical protein [Tateyamaria omphalii]
MYDGAASFYGFARTVAILGHFYSTGTINAHAPRSEVKVYLEPSEEGSYKQVIAAAALGAVVSTPLTVFITRALDDWIPAPDGQTQQIIDLLKEQNDLLKEGAAKGASEPTRDEVEAADHFIETNKDKVEVMRSITANSFKDVFRPVGKSADYVGVSCGPTRVPVGVVNERALRLIEADRPDDEVVSLLAVVTSFSRSSKTGVAFSKDVGRGFRFEYSHTERLPAEDDFSWSQYRQKPIRLNGRFVRFFDGKIKKLVVYSAARLTDYEISEYARP